MKTKRSKQVNITDRSKHVYLSIIESIKDHGGLPKNQGSKQRLSRYLKKLKEANVIRMKGYGTWELSNISIKDFLKGEKVNTTKKTPKPTTGCFEMSSHGFRAKLIIGDIKKWDKRESYLKKKGIIFRTIYNGAVPVIEIENYTIHLCNSSIIIIFPKFKHYIVENARDGKAKAKEDAKRIIKKLEKILKYKLSKNDGSYDLEITHQEHALLNNWLAKNYRDQGKELKIKSDGVIWLKTDNSINEYGIREPHLECIGGNAHTNMDVIVKPIFTSAKNHNDITGEIVSFTEIIDLIHKTNINLYNQSKILSTIIQPLLLSVNGITSMIFIEIGQYLIDFGLSSK